MAVTEETEAQVRADREAAVKRGEDILSGKINPKEEVKVDEAVADGDEAPQPVGNDDVGENESDAPDVVEVDQANPAPEPTE